MHEETFKWYDQFLLDAVYNKDQDVHNFFRLLALCHTVMPDEKDGTKFLLFSQKHFWE